MMHLFGHLLRGVFVSMKRLVSVKAQLMGPLLNVLGDAMLVREFVDSLLKLPSLNVGGERFEGQLHRTPIHPAGSIPRSPAPSLRGFYISARYLLWDICRGLQHIGCRPLRENRQGGMFHQIAGGITCLPNLRISIVHPHNNWQVAAVARGRHHPLTRQIRHRVLTTQRESDLLSRAVRAIEHQGIRHV